MSTQPVTIQADTSITKALKVMRQHGVRRLPVMDDKGEMIGIISEKDLLYASPSPATSLSIYEMHYMLTQLKVTELMTADVVTITPDTPLEEAARIMADNKIGGLPVLREGKLVGIITETDIFKVFLEMLGARDPGLRLTVEVPEQKGEIARMTTAIAQLGGNLLALGSFLGDDPSTGLITVKVEDVSRAELEAAMHDLNLEIVDVREI
jgi:acetoin utilization protein AcuB